MTTCENYGAYSHQQIRHEMCDGAGTSSQGAAMVGWHELAGRLTIIRHYLDSAIGGVLASQQGVAADAAIGAMVPLGGWLDEVQRLANDTRDHLDHQISGFTTARDSIPDVPAEPRGAGWQDYALIDPFTISDQERDEAFAAEQQRQAQAAMMLYQNTTNERVSSVVRFAPPPAGAPELTIPAGHRPGVGAAARRTGVTAAGAEPGAPAPHPGTDGVAGLSGAPGAPGGPAGLQPAPTGAQGGAVPAGAEHVGGHPLPGSPAPPGGAGAGGLTLYPAGVGRPGPGRIPAGRIGPAGPGGEHGRPAGGGLVSRAGRAPGSGGIGPARGAGPTGSAGHPPPRGRGMTGGDRLGNAGTSGAAAPLAGASGRCEEEHERHRPSFLLEPDSNRLVGTLPPTAPAVIGDEQPNDDEPSGP